MVSVEQQAEAPEAEPEVENEVEGASSSAAPADAADAAADSAAAGDEQPDTSRTFPLDVASAGADRLRCTVKTKLSEFMGSYTDDVLAEYVVVLVGHGKQRQQATADLEAFLGGQSEAFVSWLWEHLTLNLTDYATQASEQNDQQQDFKEDVAVDGTSDGIKEPIAGDPVENRQELKRGRSPEPWSRRRKTRTETKEIKEQKEASPPKEIPDPPPPRLRPSRRLLEFAVRDAVAPSAGASRRNLDATTKRLRSVVATTDHDKSSESNGKVKTRPAIAKQAKSSPTMLIALKAAAAAAEDVTNRKPAIKTIGRFTNSVWDRLGGKSDDELPDHQNLDDAENEITEKMEYVHVSNLPRNAKGSESQTRRSSAGDRTRGPGDSIPATHYTYDDDQNDQQFERQIEEVPETRKESKRHSVRKERRQAKPEEPVHYKRSSHSDKQKDVVHVERRTKPAELNHARDRSIDLPNGKEADSQDVTEMKKRMRQVELEVTKLRTKQVEATKGSEKSTTPAPTVAANPPSVVAAPTATLQAAASKPATTSEDSESRIIAVTNVHFATSKEAISTHFASCGEVVKVTILTDGAGKPKGSAHVEFSSKDAADKALAMNESSLLSRPLRVVRKDASNVVAESSSSVMRPAVMMRPVRMPIRAFPRAAFMRGSPYGLRPPPPRLLRPPAYPVAAPHLQWKRDGATGPATAVKNGFRSGVGGPMRKRSLSYVRPVVPTVSEAAALPTSAEEQKGS